MNVRGPVSKEGLAPVSVDSPSSSFIACEDLSYRMKSLLGLLVVGSPLKMHDCVNPCLDR
jgi:hypothetical protein